MFSAIYYESELADHPRVLQIRARFEQLPHIPCERYGEIFNRKAQNFRLQKQAPALILARKHGKLVLPAPAGYGFPAQRSFYFSHMLNCLYDCRYCFLQGMFRSGHYVLFVNYEDFGEEIDRMARPQHGNQVFYSGYDCDSLALDPVSAFSDFVLDLFRGLPHATLELRTKSTQVRSLLSTRAMANVIVAMSFSTEAVSRNWEDKVPAIGKRLDALARLQEQGWPVALRFEPVLPQLQTVAEFRELFDLIFSRLDCSRLHSVSVGEFRMPNSYFKTMERLYPDSGLLARETSQRDGMTYFQESHPGTLLSAVESELLSRIDPVQYYRCA